MPHGLLINQPTASDGRHHDLSLRRGMRRIRAGEPRKLTLGGPIVVDFGNTNDITAFFADNIPIDFDFSGASAVFQMLTGNSHVEIRGSILNARGLL